MSDHNEARGREETSGQDGHIAAAHEQASIEGPKRGFFKKAAKYVGEKSRQAQISRKQKLLLGKVLQLKAFTHHASALERSDLRTWPTEEEIKSYDLEALQSLARETINQDLQHATVLQSNLQRTLSLIGWCNSKITSLNTPSGCFHIDINETGITRANLRRAIREVINAASERGGAIGGGSASGMLTSVEKEMISCSVVTVPEEYRRALVAFLTTVKFSQIDNYSNAKETVSLMLLTIAWEIGDGSKQLTNKYVHEVLSKSLPGFLTGGESLIRRELVKIREAASQGETELDRELARILNGEAPDFDLLPIVSGLLDNSAEEVKGADREITRARDGTGSGAPDIPQAQVTAIDEILATHYGSLFGDKQLNVRMAARTIPEGFQGETDAPAQFFTRALEINGLGKNELNPDFDTLERRKPIQEAREDFEIAVCKRSVLSLSPEEKAALMVSASLEQLGQWNLARHEGFNAMVAWGNDRCTWMSGQNTTAVLGSQSPGLIGEYLKYRCPDYDGEIRQMLEIGRKLAENDDYPAVKKWLGKVFVRESDIQQGASDAASGLIKTWTGETGPDQAFLYLGHSADTQEQYYFDGDESLLTIGAPGSGKTQGQAIPALLFGNASKVVLDIKGELLAVTAGHLQERGERILRFSLLGDGAPTHTYNPLASLPSTPEGLWDKAYQIAELLLPEGRSGDGMWIGNARNLLACHICIVKLERGDLATLSDMSGSIKGRTIDASGEMLRVAPIDRFDTMLNVAEEHGFIDLADEIAGLSQIVSGESGTSSKLWQSILLGIRPLMNLLMSDTIKAATRSSSWSPADLRQNCCTVFIQVRDIDIDRFQPLLRVIVGQHLQFLMETSRQERPDTPVTFILDELPQLGDFPEVTRAIEVGRSSRVRVWGFVQNMQQIENVYSKPDVLLESTAIQCFMTFDEDTRERLSSMMGTRHDPIKDQRIPVMEPADFLKPEMQGLTVFCARGAQPVFLPTPPAWEIMPELLNKPYVFTEDGFHTPAEGTPPS